MRYRSAFCTLESVIRQLELSTATDYDLASAIDTLIATKYANSIARLQALIFDQSEQLEQAVNRVGIPYQTTWTLKGREWEAHYSYDRYRGLHLLSLPDDMLTVSAYSWSGTALDAATYDLFPIGNFPAYEVGIYQGVSFTPPSQYTQSVALTGIWGYHRNPAAMWLNSGDTVQENPFSSSDTALTVTDADGVNGWGLPRFETLQYLRIENEFLLVTGVNTTTNVITVQRGVNGTTAASHAQGTTIETYVPDDLFASAVQRRVVFLYGNPAETRRIVPLPDGTLQLDDEIRIPLPPRRLKWWTV